LEVLVRREFELGLVWKVLLVQEKEWVWVKWVRVKEWVWVKWVRVKEWVWVTWVREKDFFPLASWRGGAIAESLRR
jgi:hypothetical protein